jgi:DNA primase
MSNLTDWIKYELYPSIFHNIDQALPEHNFKKYSGGWRSNTYLDGSPHKRPDKTKVSKKAPGLILEQGGDCLTLVDYVMKRDSVDVITAVKTLADTVGLQLPPGDAYNKETYQKNKDQATLLEVCNEYFMYCLHLPGSKGANEIMAYLNSRGYSPEEVKAMELGYIPSQEKLFEYLLSKDYTRSQIDEVVSLNKGIGSTHRLSIPYRSGGSLKGFKFRAIGGSTPKYLNSTDLDKSGGFFNLLGLKGDKDLVIVEGELDSLHATVKGVENVVATGGSSISSDQIKDAIRRGAKSFTICLDTEPGKEETTTKNTISAIEVILQTQESSRVYISTLPDLGGGKTDPDRLIKEHGIGEFKRVIASALPYYEYYLNNTIAKYANIEDEKGQGAKNVDNFQDEVIGIASRIYEPLHRDSFLNIFTKLPGIQEIGITKETLEETVNRIRYNKEKETQSKDLNKLISKAAKLQTEGKTEEALDLLDSRVKEVKLQDKATEFSSILMPITEDELKLRQANKPESLNSGYKIEGEDLLLPSGALSVFTAPTSHGKTTFLINLALNVTKQYENKEIYLFSYEEDADSILLNALNTYQGERLSTNNRRSIKSYFATGSLEWITEDKRAHFTEKKDRFFRELIATRRLNINYSSYNSDTIIEAIRYLHKHANPGAIFIDYIQLLNLPEGKYKTYSRQEEMKGICIALKDLAVETGLPIILGAQFNRTVVNQLHIHATKIGEAGDIERIANLIVGFWNNNFKPLASEGDLQELNGLGATAPNTFYVEILKYRGARVGLKEILNYDGNKGIIENFPEL